MNDDGTLETGENFLRETIQISAPDAIKHVYHKVSLGQGNTKERHEVSLYCEDCHITVGNSISTSKSKV